MIAGNPAPLRTENRLMRGRKNQQKKKTTYEKLDETKVIRVCLFDGVRSFKFSLE